MRSGEMTDGKNMVSRLAATPVAAGVQMHADRYEFVAITVTRKAARVGDDLDAARGTLLAVVLGAFFWAAMGVIVWVV